MKSPFTIESDSFTALETDEWEDAFALEEIEAPTSLPQPVFRFDCTAGCLPVAPANCRGVVRQAMVDAIALCSRAASLLEASPPSTTTRSIFRSFFGHDPSRPVPWAGNKASGAIVAHRLRKTAEAFHRRVIHVRCGGFPGAPAGQQCGGANAFVIPSRHPNVLFLCPPFWNLAASVPSVPPITAAGRARVARFWRAGILLHEMLHLLYRPFFRHQSNPPHPDDPQERRRDNSHCYEAFVLRITGHRPDPADLIQCRDNPV